MDMMHKFILVRRRVWQPPFFHIYSNAIVGTTRHIHATYCVVQLHVCGHSSYLDAQFPVAGSVVRVPCVLREVSNYLRHSWKIENQVEN